MSFLFLRFQLSYGPIQIKSRFHLQQRGVLQCRIHLQACPAAENTPFREEGFRMGISLNRTSRPLSSLARASKIMKPTSLDRGGGRACNLAGLSVVFLVPLSSCYLLLCCCCWLRTGKSIIYPC